MTKPFHAGRAAESGIVAADLAALDWTASDEILEAPRGFFHAAGGGYDSAAIEGKLGKPWTFASPGVSIKPFPSGSLTHPGMTEMLRLIKQNNIRANQVEAVSVGTNKNMPNALIHHHPTDALQGKFSMEFCMAVLLLYGKAGLTEFTDEVVRRKEVQDMIQRIHFGVNAEAEAAGYNKMTTIIEIKLQDGRTISGRADFGKGSPVDPMSFDDVANHTEPGPIPTADDVARPRRRHAAGATEETLAEGMGDDLGAGFGAAIGVVTAEAVVLGERASVAFILVNLVAGHHDGGLYARHGAYRLQQIRGSHDIDGIGSIRLIHTIAKDGAGGGHSGACLQPGHIGTAVPPVGSRGIPIARSGAGV